MKVDADTAAKPASPPKDGADKPSPRVRRIPLSLFALVGTVVAGGYGAVALGMRFGPPLVMVALGGMTLALCAVALWRVIDPLTRPDAEASISGGALGRAPHRVRELEREKQAVLKAIKEIELDYQMRKISESDYREMVDRYRSRALRVMGDLATGDDYRALIERELKARLAARAAATATSGKAAGSNQKAPAPPPSGAGNPPAGAPILDAGAATSGACLGCGTGNDADARFCKSCGKPLTDGAPSA